MEEQEVLNALDRIYGGVIQGRIKETDRLVAEALESGCPAQRILDEALIPAMKEAGSQYRMQEADIPKLLCAARSMQTGMYRLELFLENPEGFYLGKAIIGTAEGDLHEVGKNLVAIMFRSTGFEVIDLGVDVSEKQFLKAVRENSDASVVCVSCLLTTTIPQVRKIVRALRSSDRGNRLHIMVGGGSMTAEVAREIGADMYTEDAVDAAAAAKQYILGKERKG